MKKDQEPIAALHDIRKMMTESSKFLSLSGLAGVIAGVYALVGAYCVHHLINEPAALSSGSEVPFTESLQFKIILIALSVLFLSVTTATILSIQKARKLNQRLFDHTSKKVFWNMCIPLGAGGIFCIALINHHLSILLSAAMLLFYGLALFNSSKFTMPEIRVLGLLQIILGLIACFLPGYGLILWSLGFGVLHIIYGAILWNKYDRTA